MGPSTKSEQKYSKGKHPNSLSNLKPGSGRKPKAFAEEDKKRRYLTVTETGWEGVKPIIKQLGCSSVSEFLEKLGRGEIKLSA
ncbi:MAG: hypothetical protein QNJ54_24400 [Prochloraceae cyanobacterium]|nr:hypothetical protein [Prochloraceae cyanobacterium]